MENYREKLAQRIVKNTWARRAATLQKIIPDEVEFLRFHLRDIKGPCARRL